MACRCNVALAPSPGSKAYVRPTSARGTFSHPVNTSNLHTVILQAGAHLEAHEVTVDGVQDLTLFRQVDQAPCVRACHGILRLQSAIPIYNRGVSATIELSARSCAARAALRSGSAHLRREKPAREIQKHVLMQETFTDHRGHHRRHTGRARVRAMTAARPPTAWEPAQLSCRSKHQRFQESTTGLPTHGLARVLSDTGRDREEGLRCHMRTPRRSVIDSSTYLGDNTTHWAHGCCPNGARGTKGTEGHGAQAGGPGHELLERREGKWAQNESEIAVVT